MPNRLQISPPFSTLPVSAMDRIQKAGQRLEVGKGHLFFEEGEPAPSAFVLLEGRVQVQHLRRDGSVHTPCVIGPGGTFCCLPILDGGPYPATAVAATPGVVFSLPCSLFRHLLPLEEPGLYLLQIP